MNKIRKVKDTFVLINEKGIKMATMHIETLKCVGATMHFNELYEHVENYKKTNLEYVKKEKAETKKYLEQVTKIFHEQVAKFEKLETLEKELEAKCNTDKK